MMARFRPRTRAALPESDDFIVDNNRINLADADVFKRDPVNLIRIFRWRRSTISPSSRRDARGDALAEADRRAKLRENPGSQPAVHGDPDLEQRRRDRAAADERDRRARPFIRAFGKIVAMMQFNMYHHYTVDEHLLRCIGILAGDRARRQRRVHARQRPDAQDPARAPRGALHHAVPARHRQGPPEDHSIAGAKHGAAASARGSASRPPKPNWSPG
jgi:[protein-PII] uridylyltransferase